MRGKFHIACLLSVLLITAVSIRDISAQPVPAWDENVPHLMTFGKEGATSWGDDDFSQTFFFKIPRTHTDPFYIRVFDPDTGGEVDELNGEWNTKMSYSIYGGAESYSHEDAKGLDPVGNYRSGVLLASRTFGNEARFDNQWYTFGPFNPAEGEFVSDFDGYIFKIICEGEEGDDGNMYNYYLSRESNENVPIEDGNAFTYEYSFRMWNDNNVANIAHIYPYVDTATIFVKQRNFDWDNDGYIRVVSVVRKGQLQEVSGEDEWAESQIKIYDEELNSSLDFQFIKNQSGLVRNNNVVISVENQYGELLPFFTIPIGGVPVYKAQPKVTRVNDNY
jgi:hypothetical protein